MARFVGRRAELAALGEIVAAAAQGEVEAAIVVGDPGSGKTRLLAELADRARLPNSFRVTGYEAERGVPFAAAADFLRALDVLDSVQKGSGAEPLQIFETVHRALRRLGPTMLLVDDLQWVDGLSLALCHYLARAAETDGAPLALIAVSRPSPQASSFARFTEIALGPLAREEAMELVNTLAPKLEPAAARTVVERSGGSPFWLEALVHTAGVEADAAHLVMSRVRGASADAASLLALLAVAARPLALDDVAALTDWGAERSEHAARELVARGVALETGGTVQLVHDLIRAAVARQLPAERRVALHRAVGQWLERIAGNDVRRLREALGHLHAAGLSSVDLAARLARSPHRTLLGEEGLDLLVTIADASPPVDAAALELNDHVAALASSLGRHDVALERRLLLAERSPEALERARALLEAARSAFALDDRDGAGAYLSRARTTATADELLELELDTQQAVLDLWGRKGKERGRVDAHAVAERARRLLDADDGARPAYLEALRVEYEAAYQEDDVAAMVRAAEDRADAARSFDDEAYFTASLASARAWRRAGRLDEALERARHVWDDAQRLASPRLMLDAGYWLATFLLLRGRVAEAEEVAADTADLAARVGDEARGRHAIERLVSEVKFHRGEWREGVDRLLAYARTRGEHAGVELHQYAALWLALVGGESLAAQVKAEIAEAWACAEAAGCPRCATELRLFAADALARVGSRTDAVNALREWESMQTRPQPRDRFLQHRIHALLDGADAPALLESAVREAEELALTIDALWTRIDLGSTLAATDRAQAKRILEAAAQAAGELGALTEEQVAEQRLRALGVRTWRRGAGAELLTERERAIAQLVAAGATNPEIAQQLFLSRKTVERHVSNVLRKVGVRNRAELAAKVVELEVEGAHR